MHAEYDVSVADEMTQELNLEGFQVEEIEFEDTPRPARRAAKRVSSAARDEVGIPATLRGLGDATEMYLSEIGGSQLLTADEEKSVAER